MDRLFSFLMVLLIALMASPSVKPAKASWRSSYDTPTSGYCASAPPGQPISHYLAKDPRFCPENQRSGTVRRKTQKSTAAAKKTKSTPLVGCSATPIRYRYRNETVQSSLSAKAGERCVLTRRPDPGSGIGALKIIVQPRNGSVQSLEGYSVAYTPRRGFKGNDRFVQRVCEDSNLEGTKCTNIEYVVTVY
jgi:hypothetical protein